MLTKESSTTAMTAPKGYKLKGLCRYDGRICFSLEFFNDQADADICGAQSTRMGNTYNGGWLDGKTCGREKQFDFTDPDGVRWYAVSL